MVRRYYTMNIVRGILIAIMLALTVYERYHARPQTHPASITANITN